jgi:hypothetical protein
MSTTKMTISVKLPLLPGSLSTAQSTCGKPNCICKAQPPKLHGTYYRWTGIVEGKRTTVTLSAQEAKECGRRLRNYKTVKKVIDKMLQQGLKNAPWKTMRP